MTAAALCMRRALPALEEHSHKHKETQHDWARQRQGIRYVGVLDAVRNLGLVGWVELAPCAGAPGARAYGVLVRCFEKGVLTRYIGDTLAFSPQLIVEEMQIEEIFRTAGRF